MRPSDRKSERLRALREQIEEVAPAEAHRRAAAAEALLLDIREPAETAAGMPTGALAVPRSFLELRIDEAIPDPARPLLLLCASGERTLFAVRTLRELGFASVASVAGGFRAWKEAGLPVTVPPSLTADERERYDRHLRLPEVGEEGQLRLRAARVLCVGAGGLGSPAAFYLAAAGVGTLGLIDPDVVDRSNLQRQILHTDRDVGRSKVASATERLNALAPTVEVVGYERRLDAANVEEVLEGYDVVVDGTDNFATRYLINDACVRLGKPNVHGSIHRFEGQVSVFAPPKGPCYRCLFPAPPAPELAPSCAEAGVLGVLPGVVGTLQATEVLKLLLKKGEPLVGRLLAYDALQTRFHTFRLSRREDCRSCGEGAVFEGYEEIEAGCRTEEKPA